MLLEITSIYEPPQPLSLEVDPYVPVTFGMSPYHLYEPYLWFCEGGGSLIELKVDRYTSAILRGVLVSCGPCKTGVPVGFSEVSMRDGVPTLATVPLPSKPSVPAHDRSVEDIEVHRNNSELYVTLSSKLAPEECLRSGRVAFYVGGGHLLGLGFFDLGGKELEMLDRHCGRSAF